MTKDHVISHPRDLMRTAESLRSGSDAPPQSAHDALGRFLMGHQPAGLPHEDSALIDFASSVVIARSPDIVGQLVVTEGIEELGPIVRDGVLPPYMHGSGLKLHSDIVTDPLLQRTGCLPVCAEAGVQHIVQLLLALPEPGRFVDGSETALPPEHQGWVTLAGDMRRWGAKAEPIDTQFRARLLLQLGAQLPGNSVLEKRLRAEVALAARRWKEMEKPPVADVFAALDLALGSRRKISHIDVDRIRKAPAANPLDSHWIFQGAGDLSFNAWNVALVRSPQGAKTIIPPGEPFSQRRYRCLVGWKGEGARPELERHVRQAGHNALLGNSLAMLELEFAPGHVSLPKCTGFERRDITDYVAFAVFGKSVIWGGQPVAKHQVAEQFSDVRHLFALPRVPSKTNGPDVFAFGQAFNTDFWVLERALLEDPNLLRLACLAAIEVPLDAIGLPQDVITASFRAAGYVEQARTSQVGMPGQFAWSGAGRKRLHVFLRPAAYPCSMIALGKSTRGGAPDADALYCLAWGHGFQRGRFRLWEDCAAALQALGATHALALDEGEDVFQVHLRPGADADFNRADIDWDSAALAKHMPVPFAFDTSVDGQDGDCYAPSRHYKRPAMRASLNFRINAPTAAAGGDPDSGASS